MTRLAITFCFLFTFFISCSSNKSDELLLDKAWRSTFYYGDATITFITIDDDSTGNHFHPSIGHNCYDKVPLSITNGIMLIGDKSYKYDLTDSYLNIIPLNALDTLEIGYYPMGEYVLIYDATLKLCD
ncbi:hypothetical protein JNL27_14935 [bacterium]|nr:hypothetical protein [bacterium]